jgi:YidC/Oxa1 family membrane protein insertase
MSYVYVFHSMVSTHMIYDADGFDHYDTVLLVGPFMTPEIRRREELAGLPAKELVEHGYGRLDAILAARDGTTRPANDPPVVLVAPSWGPHCLFEAYGAATIGPLLDAGFEVIARPHPMTTKRTPAAVPALQKAFGGHERFTLEQDVASQASLQRADLMVSDWSGAALEFAFGLERPVLFVDVPRKVNNPDWEQVGIEPFEATVRTEIGEVLPVDALSDIGDVARRLVADPGTAAARIAGVRDRSIANVGASGPVAAALVAAKADAWLGRST